MAHRLSFERQPLHSTWSPDHLDVTVGYIGDFTKPNFFSRSSRLGEANYVQALASKKFGERVNVSAEVDHLANFEFTREAVSFARNRSLLLDHATFESVGRVSNGAAFGWTTSVSNTLDPKGQWHAGLVYAQIPSALFLDPVTSRQALLTTGDFSTGKHAAMTLVVSPVRNLEIGFLGSRRVDSDPTAYRWRANFHVSYQFAGWLNRVAR